MPDPVLSNSSLVAHLEPLMHAPQARISLQDIIDRVQNAAGLAPAVFVLTLPLLLPMPPGASTLLSLPLLLVAPQMIFGRTRLWLPKGLARQSVAKSKLEKTFRRVLPWLAKAESVVRPRLTFLTGRIGAAACGLICTVLAVVLILPIPMGNLAPAVTVCVITLGLARRDGVVVLAGFAIFALSAVLVVWGLRGARLGWQALEQML